jgi:glyceraldehyde 3-phosphate dehydrogenase
MGRIGRAALKVILEAPELELVAVNDIASAENKSFTRFLIEVKS